MRRECALKGAVASPITQTRTRNSRSARRALGQGFRFGRCGGQLMPWSNQGGGPWGSGPKGPWGSGSPPSGSSPPDLEDLLRRGQDKLRNVLPGGGLGGTGVVIIGLLAVALWLASGIFQVAPDRIGGDSQGHTGHPDSDRRAVRRGRPPRHPDTRRAGGELDAHRRREHRG